MYRCADTSRFSWMLLRLAVLTNNISNPASLCFPFVKLKGPILGSPLCILLHCHAQWTHARRLFAFWDACGIRFQGRTRSLQASTSIFFMPLRKPARMIYAGWKEKGNNCILMGALLCILGHAVIIMVDTLQKIIHEMRTFLYSGSAQILFTRTAMYRDCCKGKSHATDYSNACGKYSGCC